MQADDVFRTSGRGGDFVDIQRRCVRRQDRSLLANGVQIAEHLLFYGHVLEYGFDDEVKALSDYIASLEKLLDKALTVIAPGHGDPIDNPYDAIDWIIKHRLEREAKVIAVLEAHPISTITELVPHVYGDVHERLYGVAERSLLAHLLKLEDDESAKQESDRWNPIS